MQTSKYKHLLMVVYDGIGNSVFESLVLTPLLKDLESDAGLVATLVSYERKPLAPTQLKKLTSSHPRLSVTIFKKPPFLGAWVLDWGAFQLKRWMKDKTIDQIIARGPLAGWIVLKATTAGAHVTTQARGLCAQEHRYATAQQSNILKTWKNKLTYRHLEAVEREVFGNDSKHLRIESVSPALKDYLVKTFNAPPDRVILATRDLPEKITPAQVTQWRMQTREKLKIPSTAYVFCYSGSYKPWQCADQTMEYFAEHYAKDKNSFLLVLTPDVVEFQNVLKKLNLPASSYLVLKVWASALLENLAAADAGFLFREPDIINWVSRPTKMLEYQAVGLKIIHNSTIAWLVDEK